MALSALPCWRNPPNALSAVIASTAIPVAIWPIKIEAIAAPTRMICM